MAEIPPWLRPAVDAAMSDLQVPAPVPLRVEWDPAAELLLVTEGDAGAGFWAGEARGAQLVVDLAHWLQDQVFPESESAWGQARPACPGHPHPASPALLAGAAWWVCPADGHQVAPIGSAGSGG